MQAPEQDVRPGEASYVPVAHTEHVTPLPAPALYEPAAQIVHPTEFAVDAVPLYPAAHTLQSAVEVDPVLEVE